MTSIPFLDAERLGELLPYPALIEALREAFRMAKMEVPPRHHYRIHLPDGHLQTLLLMPAWKAGEHIGLKMVTVTPGNEKRDLPAIQGLYVLLDGQSGVPRLLLDGPALTARRTAAASALAARYLAHHPLQIMLMVGTGALSLPLMEAHSTYHPIPRIFIWGRHAKKAQAKAEEARARGLEAEVIDDLEDAARKADLISCATLSSSPLIKGEWLKEGCHLDLVGGFTPEMRETDDVAIQRARLFVDTRQGAMHEAGDIVDPLRRNLIQESDIAADLFDLCQGGHLGRGSGKEITLFKSVGTAIEDLAAAELAGRLGAEAYSINISN